MATIEELFPHTSPLARFLVAMAMARNDTEHAAMQAGAANDADAPEFGYYVRLATGHAFEGVYALQHWRQEYKEVREFIATLPQKARDDLKLAVGTAQRIGSQALEHSRNMTFHYPHPSERYSPDSDEELSEVLDQLSTQDASLIVKRDGERLRMRLGFADDAALFLAMRRFEADKEKLREQVTQSLYGAAAFVRFVDRALDRYLEDEGVEFGEPVEL